MNAEQWTVKHIKSGVTDLSSKCRRQTTGTLNGDMAMVSNYVPEQKIYLSCMNKADIPQVCKPQGANLDVTILLNVISTEYWLKSSWVLRENPTHKSVQCLSDIMTITLWQNRPESGTVTVFQMSQIPFYYSRIIALWQLSACDYLLAVSWGSHNIR